MQMLNCTAGVTVITDDGRCVWERKRMREVGYRDATAAS